MEPSSRFLPRLPGARLVRRCQHQYGRVRVSAQPAPLAKRVECGVWGLNGFVWNSFWMFLISPVYFQKSVTGRQLLINSIYIDFGLVTSSRFREILDVFFLVSRVGHRCGFDHRREVCGAWSLWTVIASAECLGFGPSAQFCLDQQISKSLDQTVFKMFICFFFKLTFSKSVLRCFNQLLWFSSAIVFMILLQTFGYGFSRAFFPTLWFLSQALCDILPSEPLRSATVW